MVANETQESIGSWAVETFGGDPGLTPRHCIRLLEEVLELCLAEGAHVEDLEEAFGAEILKWTAKHASGGIHWERYPELDKVPAEMADCAIVLDVLAHRAGIDLRAEVDRKMAVNRARRWRANGDGTGYHVKDEGE